MAGTTTQRRVDCAIGSATHSTIRQHNALVDDVETLRAATAGAVLTGSATYDPPSLTTGSQQTTTVTVTGAALGDQVMSVSFSLDLQATLMLGYVSAANTVTVVHRNGTAGTLDLASGTVRVLVAKQAAFIPVAAATLTAAKVGDDSGTAV